MCNIKQSLVIIYGALAILLVVAYFVGGIDLIFAGLNISFVTTYKSIIMLVASFIIIGQVNVMFSVDTIEKWLKKFSGMKAILVSSIAGGFFPGPPYVYYPFISSFNEKNLPFYIFITFIFGKQVYDFTRFPMEISLISPKVAFLRYLITLPMPIIVGLLALKLYGNTTPIQPTFKAGEKGAPGDDNI